ncbi:MAG TPA: hypothetical protein VM101_05820 [Flavitalea sp.]|nr:hypothetical protein [Flavitalea sp.]
MFIVLTTKNQPDNYEENKWQEQINSSFVKDKPVQRYDAHQHARQHSYQKYFGDEQAYAAKCEK